MPSLALSSPEPEIGLAVEGDGGMLLRAVSSHAEVVRIVTRLSGPVIEAGPSRVVIGHGPRRPSSVARRGVPVTLRYALPEPLTLEWLLGVQVALEVTHATSSGPTRAHRGLPPLDVRSLVVRDDAGGVLVSACDGEENEPAGLDIAIREVDPERPSARRALAFTTASCSVHVEVGKSAVIESRGQCFRAHALRAGRRPAFYLRCA
ncbi:MAG: hypothetical protein HYY06_09465 [Deltaproteobacteria bacterium]|nr:hypothetical protein [Deltaproteobacteria bacterium]